MLERLKSFQIQPSTSLFFKYWGRAYRFRKLERRDAVCLYESMEYFFKGKYITTVSFIAKCSRETEVFFYPRKKQLLNFLKKIQKDQTLSMIVLKTFLLNFSRKSEHFLQDFWGILQKTRIGWKFSSVVGLYN